MALAVGASSTPATTNFGTTVTTAGITTAASGSTFAILINYGGSTAPTGVTDSKGNTYTLKLTAPYNSSTKELLLYTCENGTGGSSHTATVTFGGTTGIIAVLVELTGGATYDTGAIGAQVNSASHVTSSITTTAADVLLSFFGGGDFTTTTVNNTTGFNSIIQSDMAGGSNGVEAAVGAFVQSGAGSITDTFTLGASINGTTLVAAWKPAVVGPTNYTLNGAAGAYVVSGQSATLARTTVATMNGGIAYGAIASSAIADNIAISAGGTVNYTLSGAAGAYTVAGQAGSIKVNRKLSGSAGSYTVTGNAGTLALTRKLSGSVGSYAIAGQAGTLTYTPGATAVHYTLSGTAGAYTVAGQAGAFKVGHTLSGSAGAYTVTGNAGTLALTRRLAGSAGAYAVTGQAGGFKVAHSLSGASGAYSVAGQAATLTYTPGNTQINYTLSGAVGSYTVTGQAATFKVGHTLSGASGGYTVSGQVGSFKVGHSLSGAAGSYAVTGQVGTFKVAHSLSGSAGAYVVSGNAATLTYHAGNTPTNYTLAGDPGSYQVHGNEGQFVWSGLQVVVNSAGFPRFDRGHYKYKYKLKDEELEAIESAATERISTKKLATLQSTMERMGVAYHDAYKKAFDEIITYLRAEKAEQDAEDEQIAQIIASLL